MMQVASSALGNTVLGLLRDGVARHGYAMLRELRDRAGMTLSSGNLYRELHRLCSLGLIRAADTEADGDPRRAPYTATDRGSRAFDTWMTTARPRLGNESDLAIRALFCHTQPPSAFQHILGEWEIAVRVEVDRLTLEIEFLQQRGKQPVRVLLLRSRLNHLKTNLEFVQGLISLVGARMPVAPLRITKPAA